MLVKWRSPSFGMSELPAMIGITLRFTVLSDAVLFFRWMSSNAVSVKSDGERDGLLVERT
jgi:hypothetical protein